MTARRRTAGLSARGGQDGLEAGLVADGAQRGHRGLPAERVLVVDGHGAERGDGARRHRLDAPRRPRPRPPRPWGPGSARSGRRSTATAVGARPASSAARRRTDGSGSRQRRAPSSSAPRRPEAGQGPEGHHPDPGVRGPQAGPHGGLVTPVPGQGDGLGRRVRCPRLKSGRRGPTERCRHHEKEKALSHMVIYRTADGQPGYHQAEELDEAVRFVERLRNGDGVDGARIFKMEEVSFDFRPYFKVEIGPGGVPVEAPVTPAFAGRDHGFVRRSRQRPRSAPALRLRGPGCFDARPGASPRPWTSPSIRPPTWAWSLSRSRPSWPRPR